MSDVVKYFHSGMAGAPQMSNGMGQMISVLDSCLINGFNSLSPSSITRSGDVATATYGTAHGYEVDQVLLVSGCDQTAYNGEKRILSVPTNTTLTFAVAGTPISPATSASSFNTKAAPLGFTKIFSATNKAMYQSQNTGTNQWILRLDGTAWTGYSVGKGIEYQVDICRAATDINTMVENTTASAAQFGQFRWHQTALAGAVNSTAPTTNINWALFGNDKQFFFTVGWHSSYPTRQVIYGFGEVSSYVNGDAYSTFLMASNYGAAGGVTNSAHPTANAYQAFCNTGVPSITAAQSNIILAKNYTGIGAFSQAGMAGFGGSGISGLSGGVPAANPQDYSVLFMPLYVQEAGGGIRGELRGLYSTPNQLADISTTAYEGAKFKANISGVNKTFRIIHTGSNSPSVDAFLAVDITGEW